MESRNTVEQEAVKKTTGNYMHWYYIVDSKPIIYDAEIGTYMYENNEWKSGPKDNILQDEWDKLAQKEFDIKFPDLLASFEAFKQETLFISKHKNAIIKMLFPEILEHNFLHVIEKFSKEEQDKIKKALEMAKKAHENQFRDEWLPYYVHCISTAKDYIDQWWDAVDAIVILLLHDTIEDNPEEISYEEIKKEFGEDVAKSVLKLSKVRNGIKMDIDTYYAELKEDNLNLKRKWFDRLNNLRSLYYNPNEAKVERYIKETENVFYPLLENTYPDTVAQMKDIILFLNKKIPLNDMEKNKLNDFQKVNALKKEI